MLEFVDNNFSQEKQEALLVLEKLHKYLDEGYLLHGSKNKLEVLEPRQANDVNEKRIVGNLNAVYADDDIRAPVVMALLSKKDKKKDSRSSYHGDEDNMLVDGENTTFTTGYVHVLPSDTFRLVHDGNGDIELVSDEKVVPVDVIEIKPYILKYIKGVTVSDELSRELDNVS